MTIYYREGFKYQLSEDAEFWLDFAPPVTIITPFVEFHSNGMMLLRRGYAYDGPSGPTIDDETNMQGAALHDAGYQLIRMGLLDINVYRDTFDRAFKRICQIDGMCDFRAYYYFAGVHNFGTRYAAQQEDVIFTCGQPIDLRLAEAA